jgi:cyclin-A
MEKIQNDVNPSMRAILIDWLVEVSLSEIQSKLNKNPHGQSCMTSHFSCMQVAEEYGLVPDTLYLTVNYIDRYLSGNEINRQRLQLLGVACMLIAV